jgi:copper chaperone
MITALRYAVTGEEKIHCEGCEARIRNALQRLDGVHEVLASAAEQEIALSINTEKVSAGQVEQRLQQLGYQVQPL